MFFNFNFRYSNLCQLIKSSVADGKVGTVINITGVLSHGLAFKEGYSKSWRGKYLNNKALKHLRSRTLYKFYLHFLVFYLHFLLPTKPSLYTFSCLSRYW